MEYRYNTDEGTYVFKECRVDVGHMFGVGDRILFCIYEVAGFEEDLYVLHDIVQGKIYVGYVIVDGLITLLRSDNQHIVDKIAEMLHAIDSIKEGL